MFERNRVCNSTETLAIAAELTLDTTETVTGRLIVSRSRDFAATLNGPEPFVSFEPYCGERMLVAKSAIRSARTIDAPAPAPLERVRDADGFDPYAVLGLNKSAKWTEVRAAYHHMSKIYHPDCYANSNLPDEVATYLDAMSRRINKAYSVLQTEQARLEARPNAPAPVYQSRPRA